MHTYSHEDSCFILGHMLFVAFNSLFDKADSALREVAKEVKNWNGQLGEEFRHLIPRDLLPAEGKEELRDLSLTLSRLLVFKNYFASCTKCMLCFKVDPSVLGQYFPTGTIFESDGIVVMPKSFKNRLPSGDEISRPVKHYIGEYYRKRLCGVFSLSLALTAQQVSLSFDNALEDPPILSLAELSALKDRPKTTFSDPGLAPNNNLFELLLCRKIVDLLK